MEIRDNLSDGILFVMFLKRNSLTVKKNYISYICVQEK